MTFTINDTEYFDNITEMVTVINGLILFTVSYPDNRKTNCNNHTSSFCHLLTSQFFLSLFFCLSYVWYQDPVVFFLQALCILHCKISTGATQWFSANHKTSSAQKNCSSFIADQIQIRSNLTGNWCKRQCESGLRHFYLRWNVVHFHHQKGK